MIVKRTVRTILTLSLFLAGIFLASMKPSSPREEKEEGHAHDAFEWWYSQRAAPYDVIPAGAFMRAAEYSRTQMPNERAFRRITADTSQWTSLGPDNVGGRTLAIALNPSNPNIVWAGSASGGLWKSTTGGVGASAWTYVNTGYPTVSVSSIAINPLNPNIMYIGTGEVWREYGYGVVGTPGARATYGMGVLKSTNAGTSWTLTGLVFAFSNISAVQKVLLNPLNPNTVYAATTEGTYKSIDAGTTWTLAHNVLMAMDIVINPSDTTTLFAAYGQGNLTFGKGVYKTTNAGSTWTRLTDLDTTNFGRTALAISSSNPQTVYASISDAVSFGLRGLYKTDDGGTNWALQSTENYVSQQGWYDNVIAVHPSDPDEVFCAGLDIYKNGSEQKSFWYLGYFGVVPAGGPEGPSNYAHADFHAITFHPTNPDTIYFGCDGGIFVSMDGGNSFEGRNGGYQTTQIYNGFATAETTPDIALAGLQDNGTLKYEGSSSWNKTYGGDGGWCAIDPANDNILYEEYVYLNISKSTNGGNSWFQITNGLAWGSADYANFIAPFVIAPSNPSILYAGAKVVYKTEDGGTIWSPTNGGIDFNGTSVSCIGVSYRNTDVLIAGTGSRFPFSPMFEIFRSTNGGTSWTNTTGSLPNRFPTDISFDPNSDLIAYLTYSGYGSSHVFNTTDAGENWTDISSNLPDIPVQSIVADPNFPGHLYVGTDLGVYTTTNGGTSWMVFDTGMPPAMVLDLVISNPNYSLRAATFGNGVYERELARPGLFDNRTVYLSSPASGNEVLVNTPVSSISAVFRSVGAVTSPDSFDVKYRILNGMTEVYSGTEHISPLGLGQSRSVLFDGSFTPISVGVYTLQAMCLGSDQNTSNDTLTGSLNVVSAGTIASLQVVKTYCPYTEITGGTPGPSGDDAQSSLALPFAFTFDGYTYDQLQISTNGWAEFGTGADGTERGLSTPAQIGLGNENGRLFSTARPTKALGVWFEDLNTATSGAVSYTTLDAAPDRVFVVQWKNILAYYDETSTTTRINFQLRLHEGTNIAEYHYGPVVAGTLAGGDLGAMVGMKDHLGGNYHFYDFALGGTGTTAQGVTTLSPLTDWPGVDSCFIMGSGINQSYALAAGWNLVSVALTVSDYAKATLFSSSVSDALAYLTTYTPQPLLENGPGYWLKFASPQNVSTTGFARELDTIDVTTEWNLIGSISSPVPVAAIGSIPGGIVTSAFYGYNASGYSPTATIESGKAYWVKANQNGKLILSSTAPDQAHRIRIVPGMGLPPPPPEGEVTSNTLQIPVEFGINQNYPNPFNPTTRIGYALPVESKVRLTIFDITGREVVTLIHDTRPAGYLSVEWNGKNASGVPVSSGLYLYRIEASAASRNGTFSAVRKMILLK